MTRFPRNFLCAAIFIVAWSLAVFALFWWLAPDFIPALIEKMP